ncbi:MAG: GtrA family protein, partial [Rhodomicrobium sp.]|nr:GtrA family protein [Rhodomicrobium sp.]
MQQIAIFIAVGSAAALTHLAAAGAAVELAGLHPLAANVIGFCIAFLVSFGGHARWTFPLSRERFAAARTRFFVVALTGFILNQAAYAEALRLFGRDYYLPALAAVLVGVAAAT